MQKLLSLPERLIPHYLPPDIVERELLHGGLFVYFWTLILKPVRRKQKKPAHCAGLINIERYFLRAYFSESSATAKIIMAPLIIYCQYGFTPI